MPIIRSRVAVIESATLELGLSLEAIGLWAHIQVQPKDEIDISELELRFTRYDVGALILELWDLSLLEDKDCATPPLIAAAREREHMEIDGPAVVYVMQAGTAFKVGVTGNLKARMRALQVANADVVSVVWNDRFERPVAVETRLHVELKAYRARGEWFRAPREVVDAAIAKVTATP